MVLQVDPEQQAATVARLKQLPNAGAFDRGAGGAASPGRCQPSANSRRMLRAS